MQSTFDRQEVIALLVDIVLFRTQPWVLFGMTEDQWEDLASHERGEEEDHFLDQNPEIEEALKILREKTRK